MTIETQIFLFKFIFDVIIILSLMLILLRINWIEKMIYYIISAFKIQCSINEETYNAYTRIKRQQKESVKTKKKGKND